MKRYHIPKATSFYYPQNRTVEMDIAQQMKNNRPSPLFVSEMKWKSTTCDRNMTFEESDVLYEDCEILHYDGSRTGIFVFKLPWRVFNDTEDKNGFEMIGVTRSEIQVLK